MNTRVRQLGVHLGAVVDPAQTLIKLLSYDETCNGGYRETECFVSDLPFSDYTQLDKNENFTGLIEETIILENEPVFVYGVYENGVRLNEVIDYIIVGNEITLIEPSDLTDYYSITYK